MCMAKKQIPWEYIFIAQFIPASAHPPIKDKSEDFKRYLIRQFNSWIFLFWRQLPDEQQLHHFFKKFLSGCSRLLDQIYIALTA